MDNTKIGIKVQILTEKKQDLQMKDTYKRACIKIIEMFQLL